MTTATVDATAARLGSAERRLLRLGRYIGIPLLVLAACAALYIYVQGRELDSIEGRLITGRNIRQAALEQLEIALLATALTLLVAIPLGVALTRPWARRVTPYVLTVANIGQGVPAVGLIFIIYVASTNPLLRNGRNAAVLALAFYSVLPVLRGTMVGLQQVDRGIIKAARGMGMSKRAVLLRVELPLSVPILLTGVRTALVLTVSTAALAAFIGGGTFGRFITGGFAQSRMLAVAVGSVGAAAMAILADWLGGLAEDFLRPRGL